MLKIPTLHTAIINFLSHSLRRMLLITVIAVSLIPLAFVLPSLGGNSWEPVHKDNLQKHKLLATSLVEPIKLNLNSYQHKLELLDISLQSSSLENRQRIQTLISKFTNSVDNVVAVSLLLLSDTDSPIVEMKNTLNRIHKEIPKPPEYIAKEIRYQKYGKENSISPVLKSSLSKAPILLIKHQIIDSESNKIGTLFAEVDTKFIQTLCNNISFGDKGLCAIVDNKNNIVAHPDSAWVSQIKNLSSHKLIKTLKSNNIGSLEYISSDNEIEMLGGYAKIKSLDWGIIVTRPKDEISLPLNAEIKNSLIWLIAGLIFALITAIIVILKITRPLNILSDKAKVLTQKQNTYSLGNTPKYIPADILSLWETLSDLLADYQEINSENIILESSSKKDIRKVMGSLREQNIAKDDNIDAITGLTNSTCFFKELGKSILIYRGEASGLILIEVDNYKPLVAKGNEELANHIIKHVAQILKASKRNNDMIAHFGNDGRFAIFINDCKPNALQGMAKKLRSLVEVSPIQWKKDTVYINLSTGIVAHEISEETTVDMLMSFAENALETSKNAGGNKISTYKNEKVQTT